MKIALVQYLFFGEERLGRTLALTSLALSLGAGSAAAGGVARLPAAKKPMIVEYKAACGMVYSAADAKKYHYICPMDHSKLVPIAVDANSTSKTGKAANKAPHAVPYVQASPEAQERSLYLTPGGAYTEADIRANGTEPPLEKYRGIISSHDLNPQKGDYLCPITKTKANSKFSWVIGGKTYYFCCPPCIEEFVKQAKEHPESILPPEAYIKK